MSSVLRPDPHGYADRWAEVVDHIARDRVPGSMVVAFLHAAKTGGSSIHGAVSSSGRWSFCRMRESYLPVSGCMCGDPACGAASARPLKPPAAPVPGGAVRHHFCHFSHERYSAIRWFRDALARRGVRLEAAYTVFRPARERLESMFCDYWVQAMAEDSHPHGLEEPQQHRRRIRERYRIDSMNYVDRSGRIDSRAWFRSYAHHRTGMPFSMVEMFDGSVTSLRLALRAGALTMLQMSDIDPWLRDLTGCSHVVRRRTSVDRRPPAVVAALEDAREIIDALAETDWAFDQAADEHLSIGD